MPWLHTDALGMPASVDPAEHRHHCLMMAHHAAAAAAAAVFQCTVPMLLSSRQKPAATGAYDQRRAGISYEQQSQSQ